MWCVIEIDFGNYNYADIRLYNRGKRVAVRNYTKKNWEKIRSRN